VILLTSLTTSSHIFSKLEGFLYLCYRAFDSLDGSSGIAVFVAFDFLEVLILKVTNASWAVDIAIEHQQSLPL